MSKEIRPTIKGKWPKLENGVHTICLGNGTQYEVIVKWRGDHIYFGIVGKGCYSFSGQFTVPCYAKERLGLRFDGDAANIADLLNQQFGRKEAEFGCYQISLCVEDNEGVDYETP